MDGHRKQVKSHKNTVSTHYNNHIVFTNMQINMQSIKIDVPLQEKILKSNSSLRPDKEFFQSFAAVIGSQWQCLAFPLSLTSEDIVSIKKETRGGPTRRALIMLQKWAARETATYGQLRERLRTLSVFHI